jgi:hypothetical protein
MAGNLHLANGLRALLTKNELGMELHVGEQMFTCPALGVRVDPDGNLVVVGVMPTERKDPVWLDALARLDVTPE